MRRTVVNKRCKVNFIFLEVHRSMNVNGSRAKLKHDDFARDPLRSYFGRHGNFARDPLHSYVDEPPKNEIYFLND